jgi:hypothetical protein
MVDDGAGQPSYCLGLYTTPTGVPSEQQHQQQTKEERNDVAKRQLMAP